MGSSVHAEAVVVATPASAAGRLLADLVPAAGEWVSWSYASVAVVTLVVAGLQPGPSGLLVPPGELPSIKALTYSSTKWDWVRAAAQERWGPGTTVVRASVGRLGEEHLLQLGDRDLVARTFGEAAGLPGWEAARLGAAAVTRWGGSLPQYAVGHVERVTAVRDALTGHPGLAVCGAALDGVGVASCLASATLAVGKIGRDFGEPAGQGRERG
jgi:oxygen-dependent protoporphyrinogen oxidase